MQQIEDFREDDRPCNTLDQFTELEQILDMINNLKPSDHATFEKEYEKYTEILNKYLEQPHLLDPHLDQLLGQLLLKIHEHANSDNVVHAAFKYMYILSKVRTFKGLVKFLPHELCDLEFALDLIERQDPNEFLNWETRYMLLLWLSILVLNPFPMARLDIYEDEDNKDNLMSATQKSPPLKKKMERIYDLCKVYTSRNDTCSNVCAFLAAKYFIRSDIKDIYMEPYLDWVVEQHTNATVDVKLGELGAVAAILKYGKREDLLPLADKLLQWILACQYKDANNFLKYKAYIKIVQRVGLLYLKPRIATWRYKRGTRSLQTNLQDVTPDTVEAANVALTDFSRITEGEDVEDGESGEEIVVPDAIEEVMEELLQALRASGSSVRWSAAKGIGRVTNRLSRELADEVIGSIIEILNPIEPHEAWHGACLAIAELAKRGLLLLHRLEVLVPLLIQALFYDELKGYMSVGQHIRDAACYMCWAIARAYNPEDLQPFVERIASGLLTVAIFDREVNCRRAASAAFQESVGRLGNFPHGIEICTTIDFYSVGMRQNSFLNLSVKIAQFREYCRPMIDHLLERKVVHWDQAIRELTAKALHTLTAHDVEYIPTVVLQKLFDNISSFDVSTRHGSILALGEIALALREQETEQNRNDLLTNKIITQLCEVPIGFLRKDMYKDGMSGELMKLSCTNFIRNISLAKIKFVDNISREGWQQVIDLSLLHKTEIVRESAKLALADFCKTHYSQGCEKLNHAIVEGYLKLAINTCEEYQRKGVVGALGVLPVFMFKGQEDKVFKYLMGWCLVPQSLSNTSGKDATTTTAVTSVGVDPHILEHDLSKLKWSEARRDSVKALRSFVTTIGYKDNEIYNIDLNALVKCLLSALNEYTLDDRGDIGAWVRSAAMDASFDFLTQMPHEKLKPTVVKSLICCFVQQGTELIDRVRGQSGRLLCKLIYYKPQIPYIPHHEELKTIFPADDDTVLWLFADHTFPMFCALLKYPEYANSVLMGLSASVGQLTESLIRYSSTALFDYLRSHPEDIPRLCAAIAENWRNYYDDDRVVAAHLNFMDILLSSGTISSELQDPNSVFAETIYEEIVRHTRAQKRLYRLVSCVAVYCQLLQVPRLFKKILNKLAIYLGLTHVHVRKSTASKLYEALALYGDTSEIPQENLEEILYLLSETDWGLPLVEVRPIRNKLCTLFGIPVPVAIPAKVGTT